jgi:hypothetical protein
MKEIVAHIDRDTLASETSRTANPMDIIFTISKGDHIYCRNMSILKETYDGRS